jgi:hypothetical protein
VSLEQKEINLTIKLLKYNMNEEYILGQLRGFNIGHSYNRKRVCGRLFPIASLFCVCPRCDRLLSQSTECRRELEPEEEGVVIAYECDCGHVSEWCLDYAYDYVLINDNGK